MELAEALEQRGSIGTPTYSKRWSNHVVRFAKLTVLSTEKEFLWHSNHIERWMGEISKRCPHEGMKWPAPGLESILRRILIRYSNKERYDAFLSALTHQAAAAELIDQREKTSSWEISPADIGELPKTPRSTVCWRLS